MLDAPTTGTRPTTSTRPAQRARGTTAVARHHGLSLVRRVNEEIRRHSPSGAAPFFCECGDACFHAVWLDVLAYDVAVRTMNALLLADGHAPAGVAGTA